MWQHSCPYRCSTMPSTSFCRRSSMILCKSGESEASEGVQFSYSQIAALCVNLMYLLTSAYAPFRLQTERKKSSCNCPRFIYLPLHIHISQVSSLALLHKFFTNCSAIRPLLSNVSVQEQFQFTVKQIQYGYGQHTGCLLQVPLAPQFWRHNPLNQTPVVAIPLEDALQSSLDPTANSAHCP